MAPGDCRCLTERLLVVSNLAKGRWTHRTKIWGQLLFSKRLEVITRDNVFKTRSQQSPQISVAREVALAAYLEAAGGLLKLRLLAPPPSALNSADLGGRLNIVSNKWSWFCWSGNHTLETIVIVWKALSLVKGLSSFVYKEHMVHILGFVDHLLATPQLCCSRQSKSIH